MSEYSDYGMVEAKLHDGMYDGNMHACLRDVGRIAGGCFAAGRLSPDELASLRDLAISLSRNKSLGARKWDEAVAFGQKQPLPHTNIATGSNPQSHAIGWDEIIDPNEYKIVDVNWLERETIVEPTDWDPCAQLSEYLDALFQEDEHVAYLTNPPKFGDKYQCIGGVYHKTVRELKKSLSKHTDVGLEEAFGTPNKESGAWIVVNPVDGKGRANKNVTAFRHALVESDNMPVDDQVAIYKKLELPCSVIVHSGGKSAHAVVRIDAEDENEYKKRVNFLYEVLQQNGMQFDTQNRNPSRFTRMPGFQRGTAKQFIISHACGKASWDEWEQWIKERNDNLPEFETLTESEILNPPPPPPELIEGLLSVDSKMIIAGPSKAGKSFLLIELAIAVAEGAQWLGRQCRQGRVLYVNLELHKDSFTRRLAAIYSHMKFNGPQHYSFIDRWNLRGYAEPMDKLAPKLIRRAKGKGYSVIIVDPIYKVLTGDENNAKDMGEFTCYFDRIAHECDCAIVFCHHHSKGSQGDKRSMDRASGSGVFIRDTDALVDMIQLDADSARAVLQNRMECDAIMKAVLACPDGQAVLGQISEDDKIVANQFEGALLGLWGEGALIDEIRKAREAATTKCDFMTAWRLEYTLRDFATPKPLGTWFDYPSHFVDNEGYLADATPIGEQPFRSRARAKQSKPPKQDKLTAFKQIVECDPSQVWTVAKAIERFSVTKQTISNWCKVLGWPIKKGTICTPQP